MPDNCPRRGDVGDGRTSSARRAARRHGAHHGTRTRCSAMPTCSSSGDRDRRGRAGLAVPEGTREIDARDGIVLPGMIDTHRHMWQTAMRGYGADWTLTQYFVWYYLESGRHFRPQDVHAGNLLAAAEALDAGVTTCVDWSHGLQTIEHAEARGRRAAHHARPVRARLRQHPAGAVGVVGVARSSGLRPPHRLDDDMLGFQMAFDVTGDPAFPEKAAYEIARELGVPVTTHAGVWGATNDDGIRLAHEAGFLDDVEHLRARRHALRRLLPPHRGDRRLRVRVHRERAERGPGLPADLGAARARHPGVAVDGHQRLVERRPVLRHAHHAGRRPLPRALRGARTRATRSPTARCAPSRSSTGPPAAAPARWAATPTSAAWSRARRPTSCCSRTSSRRCRSRC